MWVSDKVFRLGSTWGKGLGQFSGVAPTGNGHSSVKRILLIDAVTWSSAYPADVPTRNVGRWYARWLADLERVHLTPVGTDVDLLSWVEAEADGVVISGSPRDAWAEDPVNDRLCEVIERCRQLRKPLLGVCYGHQILGRVLGARVGRHPGGLELGNTRVELTDAGAQSPLFEGFPRAFEVLSSHLDEVTELPSTCELLVRGQFTTVQGFRCGNLFGVQFHPETDPETLRFIWSVRRETWRSRVAFDLDRTLDELNPTPLAANILRNFVTKIAI